MRGLALREARPIDMDQSTVADLLDLDRELDRRFDLAWREGLGALPPPQRRGALPGVTGHVAESLAEVMLGERGYVPVAHHPSPGRHGVDLVVLHLECEMVFAVEVKGTLRPGHISRLSARDLRQMSAAWVDKPDNPNMADAALESGDVYGAVIAINFADMKWRVSMSADFETFVPVTDEGQLARPFWLEA
jgi:hypothetical protein